MATLRWVRILHKCLEMSRFLFHVPIVLIYLLIIIYVPVLVDVVLKFLLLASSSGHIIYLPILSDLSYEIAVIEILPAYLFIILLYILNL